MMIIGICGPTGSGKGTLAYKLSDIYGFEIVNFDTFSKDDRYLEKFGDEFNYDTPSAYDYEKLMDYLSTKLHSIILEGFLIYTNSTLRSLIQHKIFLDIPKLEILRRRLLREDSDFQRALDVDYLYKCVLACNDLYMPIQKYHSDLVIDGTLSKDSVFEIAKSFLDNGVIE